MTVPASALGVRFWMFTVISTVFAVGNTSDAFIFLRAAELEQVLFLVPLLYFGYNFVYAILATPLGALSDRLGRCPCCCRAMLHSRSYMWGGHWPLSRGTRGRFS